MATKPKSKPKDDLTRPARFSLEAFAAGKVDLVKTARVTVKHQSAALARRLQAERDVLTTPTPEDLAETGPRRRMAAKSSTSGRLAAIDAELADLEAELAGSWAEVEFRALTQTEHEDVNRQKAEAEAEGETFGPARVCAAMWAICARIRDDGTDDEDAWDTLTAQQWAQFIDLIGINQFQALDRLCGSVSYGRVVGPDFSAPSSKSQKTVSS